MTKTTSGASSTEFNPEDSSLPENRACRRRALWSTLGILAAAAVTGGIAGIVVVKSLLLAKGVTVARLTIAADTAIKAAAAPIITVDSGALVGGLTAAAASSTGSTSMLAALFGTLSNNLAPLTVGLVSGTAGGGLTGFGMARSAMAQAGEKMKQGVARDIDAIREETASLRTALDAVEAPQARPKKPTGESLEDINGIGEIYAERLRSAGIDNIPRLAALSPEQVREIIGRRAPLSLEHYATWIEEAAELAAKTTT
ncbi:MAG: hypothetical protein ACRESZ_02940 [Methylococcales bacterium]